MKPFCEFMNSILPSLRSLIARELIENYNLSQKEVAKLLGITQAAVSNYYTKARGRKVRVLEKNKKVARMVKILSALIIKEKNWDRICKEYCKICKEIRKEFAYYK